jgi:hypothetical protein
MPHRVTRPRRGAWPALLVLCAAVVMSTAVAAPAFAAGDPPDGAYRPPVEAPVGDPFRPPASPYGPGNRGLLYDTAPGTPVRAAADGEVTFAGLVAGSRHVTVLHADGLRTSYSFLAEVHVVVGQRVAQGDVVGTTVDDLHLGVRAGDDYLDPASLFGTGPPRVHLVPFEEPPGPGAAGERSALRQLVGGLGGAVGGLVRDLGGGLGEAVSVATWLRHEGPQLLRTFTHYGSRFIPPMSVLSSLATGYQAYARARAAARRPCSEPGAPAPAPTERRAAVLVAGLGSTSEHGAIDQVDTERLGYDHADVVRFSYAGGRTPDAADGFTGIAATTYDAADTQRDLRDAGAALADLIEAVAEQAPGLPIDLYAHSQGGVVTRLALIELEHRHGRAWLKRLGLVATLGTPHGGADLATAVHALGSTATGSSVLDAVATGARLDLDDDAPSVAQLSETSEVIRELADAPIADELRAVSIAARGDVVVPVPRTVAPGATEVVVPLTGLSAHDELPGSPEATRELALALAGLPPTCQSLTSALLDQVVGEGISIGEDMLGAGAWLAAGRRGSPIGG